LINRLNNNCSKIHFIDINKYRIFPDTAMRDSNHLRRPGWTAEYASLLKQIIVKLELYSYILIKRCGKYATRRLSKTVE
jgi:hypothetical protein